LNKGRKGRVDVACCASAHDMDLLLDHRCRLLQFAPLEVDIRIIRVHERANRRRFWDELVQKVQLLRY
jgi:hypothetical protein